jgi:predicted PurR-regulated permease PerM
MASTGFSPFTDPRRWQWLALLLLFGGLLWLLAPVLTPFAVAALLAWLGDPLVQRLQRAGRSRAVAVGLVFALMSLLLALALLLLVPLLQDQLARLVQWLPRLGQWLAGTAVPWLEQRFDVPLSGYVDPAALVDMLKAHWQQAGGIAANVLGGISRSGLTVLGWIGNLVLIPLLTFYFLRDWQPMLGRVRELLPRPVEPTVLRLARESDEVLGAFLRGQLSVMISLGAIYGTGLWLVGIELGILIGFVAGLISFVPYLGAAIGVSAALIAAMVQHGDVLHIVLVLAVFAAGQTLESFVLTPWLVGDRIGLHPVAVIFAIMAGGQLFGFLGVLLALPVAAVVMVLLRYLHAHYRESELYGADEAPATAGPAGALPAEAASAASSAASPAVAPATSGSTLPPA